MRFHLLILFFLYAVTSAIPLQTAPKYALKKTAISTLKGASHVPVPVKPNLVPKLGLGSARTRNVKQPAKSCKCIRKRAQGPVQSALRKSKASNFIGIGNVGRVFETTYNGQKAAIKITTSGKPGGSRADIEQEVINLKAVGQFLGWGRNADNTIFYIIMRDMGRPYHIVKSQISAAQGTELREEARNRYEREFHMVNDDLNGNNYVYHKVSGVWRAEIIDWARATHGAEAHISPAGNPEVVQEYDPDYPDQKCGCVIV